MAKRRGSSVYVPTGIPGFDEITGGGLPAGRVTLVLGGAGSGKTVFGTQTLAAGARDFGEPGIFVAFEESAARVFENAATFSWKMDRLGGKRIDVLDAQLSSSIVCGGDFDLLGLLAVIGAKARTMRAKRIVLDGLDVLLGHLGDVMVARRELFRLGEWLQESHMTSVITAKADLSQVRPAREYDILQFMADCVVNLQHRVVEGTALRFVRVSKCRGTAHSSNEFPFDIGNRGIEVAPGANAVLEHPASKQRVSTGVERLDAMLGGGYYRGSSTLVTGAPGTAKTTLAAAFADAASRRNERTLFVSFDEAPDQIVRNLESVGLRLGEHTQSGLLRVCSIRSRAVSPEAHVARIRGLLAEHRARNLIVDPMSALGQGAGHSIAEAAAIQVLDLAKSQGITSISTSLLGNKAALSEETPIGVSTIADTWIHLSYVVHSGERNRALTIIKSRGTGHSNQVRELVVSNAGVTLADVYAAGGEVLMGTLRWEKENEEQRLRDDAQREADLREREAKLALAETKVRVQAVLAEQTVREASLDWLIAQRDATAIQSAQESTELRRRRRADGLLAPRPRRAKRPMR